VRRSTEQMERWKIKLTLAGYKHHTPGGGIDRCGRWGNARMPHHIKGIRAYHVSAGKKNTRTPLRTDKGSEKHGRGVTKEETRRQAQQKKR